MSEQERSPFFPPVPELSVRPPDLVPSAAAPPPVGADRPSPPSPEGQINGQQWVEVFNQTTAESLPASVDTQPRTPTGEAAPAPEARERERVHLAGRVGQDPRLKTTPKGTLVAQFPLGVKAEADIDKTTWHTIIAFQKRAEQVRDSLTKGDPVEVIGYVHERQVPRRDGSSRTIQEIYATVIKPR